MNLIDYNQLERFKRVVTERLGLCIFNEDKETFRKSLSARMKSLDINDSGEYLNLLESDNLDGKDEWKELINVITTGESYFFRDRGHFFLLRNIILPELIKKNETERSLRIWSAGCSTGEEPYSIAILLDMLLPDISSWDILITGTDINENSIEKANRGIYSGWSFRMADKDMQEKYFVKRSDEWEINESIKKTVTFRYGNLIWDSSFSERHETCSMDMIICRNVFIYFDKEAVSTVLNKFVRILKHDGFLVTGHTELFGHDLSSMNQMMFPEAVIYKKNAGVKTRVKIFSVMHEHAVELKNAIETPFNLSVKKIHASKLIKRINPEHEPDKTNKTTGNSESGGISEIGPSAGNGEYDSILQKARTYANSGEYDKASELIRLVLKINVYSADPYFLLAQIAEMRGNIEEAKEMFRKAIFLDPEFIAAYCELAAIYEKVKDIPRAARARSTAVELLGFLEPRSTVKPYDITAGELIEYIRYLSPAGDDNLMTAAPGERNMQ